MKYQKRDSKGRFAKTDHPLTHIMRVSGEEKNLILKKRIKEGTTHIKTFIKYSQQETGKKCYFCRATNHRLYYTVGKECLDEFVAQKQKRT